MAEVAEENQAQIQKLISGILNFSKNVEPKIESNTLNKIAYKSRARLKEHMAAVFDRPTPFTLNSVFLKIATPQNAQVKVWIRDEASKGNAPFKYLTVEGQGGQRPQKAFERALVEAGILGQGQETTPGPGAPLDNYGNIRVGTITQMLSALRAHDKDAFQDSKDAKKIARYIIGRNLQTGNNFAIFIKSGPRYVPLLLFTDKKQTYRKRFLFKEIVIKAYNDNIQHEFAEQWVESLSATFGGGE